MVDLPNNCARSTNLEQLHEVLQTTMGWLGGHLHQFVADNVQYGVPDDAGELAVPLPRGVPVTRCRGCRSDVSLANNRLATKPSCCGGLILTSRSTGPRYRSETRGCPGAGHPARRYGRGCV